MKFVLAPDSFKESMTAKEAAAAMEAGIRKVFPEAECVLVPMADGGEGTVASLVEATNGRIIRTEVTGPLGKKVTTEYGLLGDGETAVLEVASASGIHLLRKEERDPLHTTSYGTGELIKEALGLNVKRILIGLGGSVTNDGGVGLLQALGVSFKDAQGKELPFGGGALDRLATIDAEGLDPRIRSVHIEAICDVTNPLIGKNGASYVFGPQKGATEEQVKLLDENLTHYAKIVYETTGKDVAHAPGAGAAGGIGAALIAFLNAEFKQGVDTVIEYTHLTEKMKGADFIFTGEGSIDGQTLYGKTPYGIAVRAKALNIPVIAFAGRIGKDAWKLYEHGFTAMIGILKEASPLDQALKDGKQNLTEAVENICRIIQLTYKTP